LRVLVAEDDHLLGSGLRAGLCQDGYTVEWVGTAEAADHALRLEHFDILILDLGLPGRDGLWLLRRLRNRGSSVLVLVLTARDTLDDRVDGLDAGADDYLVKPFALPELAARLRALVRRSQGRTTTRVQAGPLTVDVRRRSASLDDKPLALSPKEFALLQALVEHADQPVPRRQLHATVYGWGEGIESNAIEVHIHNLRRKLGRARIITVRGVGYQFVSGSTH
jgi:two-component system response regulator QseB